MFKDQVTQKLADQDTAIAALAGRIPSPVPPDPATFVSVADQQEILNGISANTSKINALVPTA